MTLRKVFFFINPFCSKMLEESDGDAYLRQTFLMELLTLHKKRIFPLRICSVNVTKSAGNCKFIHIY